MGGVCTYRDQMERGVVDICIFSMHAYVRVCAVDVRTGPVIQDLCVPTRVLEWPTIMHGRRDMQCASLFHREMKRRSRRACAAASDPWGSRRRVDPRLIRFRADPVRRCTGRPDRWDRRGEDEHIYCHGLMTDSGCERREEKDMALPTRCLRFHRQDAVSSLYVRQVVFSCRDRLNNRGKNEV